MREPGITFPGKHAAAFVAVHEPDARGSLSRIGFLLASDCEKLPLRPNAVGITPRLVDPAIPRKLPQLAKKNVRSWPLYTLARSGSVRRPVRRRRRMPRALAKQTCFTSIVSCSATLPWAAPSPPPGFRRDHTVPPLSCRCQALMGLDLAVFGSGLGLQHKTEKISIISASLASLASLALADPVVSACCRRPPYIVPVADRGPIPGPLLKQPDKQELAKAVGDPFRERPWRQEPRSFATSKKRIPSQVLDPVQRCIHPWLREVLGELSGGRSLFGNVPGAKNSLFRHYKRVYSVATS